MNSQRPSRFVCQWQTGLTMEVKDLPNQLGVSINEGQQLIAEHYANDRIALHHE
jgi:hypothetical protein